MTLLATLLLGLLGAALLFVGALAGTGRLQRNRFVGVRTPATLRDEEAFQLGNRVAAPAMLAAGALGLISGGSLPLLATGFTTVIAGVLGVAGTVVLLALGGMLGHRAASAYGVQQEALRAEQKKSASASGGCCGGGCCG